ncbi:MAG: acetyltransferase [Candidatus Saganbacteria bacterium]|nr:acetyltransferase [Candidatus Saganbacteria bacterium]
MNIKEKIILLGAGGHCSVVIDAILKKGSFEIAGVLDKDNASSTVLKIKVIGGDHQLPDVYKSGVRYAFVTVGSIGNVDLRINLAKMICDHGFVQPIIIHPQAIIANNVEIGEGTFVAAGAVIGPGVKIGRNVIINTRASIDHGCKVDDFSFISPGVTLSGGVKVGARTHLGVGSSIIEYKKIGADSLIGAGSVVVSDIPARVKAFGNPCKIREMFNG